jgi:hypothetical protein
MLRAVFGGLMVWVVLAVPGRGQMKPQAEFMVAGSPQTIGHNATSNGLSNMVQRMQARNVLQQNIERQHKLVSDTNRLLALVTNFNQQANQGDAELSPEDVSKRVSEIERLARSVKERMREGR